MHIGLKGFTNVKVSEDLLAAEVGSGSVRVFATPMMVAFMEKTCAGSVQSFLDKGKTTVGVHVDVSHDAATPLGMEIRFESILTDINGKILTFNVQAFDDRGSIGKGTHKRAIVDVVRFEQRAYSK